MIHGRNPSPVRIVHAGTNTTLRLVAKTRGTTCVCGWAVDIHHHDACWQYVVPLELGGAEVITNMRLMHRRCAA